MYELQCAQVDFSNKTRVLLPVSSLAFVGRTGGGCTHRHTRVHTRTHTQAMKLHKQSSKISENK